MKLSQFRINNGTDRKIKFVNGEAFLDNERLNGEIDFYYLDDERIKKIHNEVSPDLEGDIDDDYVMYKLLPYLCDLEIDLPIHEFRKMMLKPTKEFTFVISSFVDIVRDLFDMSEEVAKMEKKSAEFKEKFGELKIEDKKVGEVEVAPIIPVETKEEKLERLYGELIEFKDDKEKRKEVLKEITELNAEE